MRAPSPPLIRFRRLAARAVDLRPGEAAAVAWSFVYFFCLLCSYYVLRPVRDEMGIRGGVENLPWAFTATFLAMLAAVPLFGWAAARLPRRRLLPLTYGFFIINLLAFYALLGSALPQRWVAHGFFVWLSVFNLFVVSVFWSFMADVFSNAQAKRLFGLIAAGGSAGALAGPALTVSLALPLGPARLLLVSAGFLAAAVVCIRRLGGLAESAGTGSAASAEAPLGGGSLRGIGLTLRSPYLLGICLYIVLFTTLSTFLYFEQAHIVRDAFASSAERTRVFAAMDLATNALTICGQLFVTGHVMQRFGVGAALALLPALTLAGFALLGAFPVLAVLVVFQVARRAANFFLARPAREVLFTAVPREEKYKAKNFIDTVVYRGGDAASGWLFAGLKALGLGVAGIAVVALPLAALWFATGLALGRRHDRLQPPAGNPPAGSGAQSARGPRS